MIERCYLCESTQRKERPGKVRDKPGLKIFECLMCGLVYLSSHEHIHDNFYEDSRMHSAEVQVDAWLKESAWDDERRARLIGERVANRSVLEFGAGAGGLAERLQSVSSRICVVEPDDSVSERFRDIGIKRFVSIEDIASDERFDFITAMHVLEHLPDPALMLNKLGRLLRDERSRLIVEVPNAADALLTVYENQSFQEFTYWSPHLYLFNAATMRRLADKAGLEVTFLRHIQRYPLSNHLYWLARGKPGGHNIWQFIDTPDLDRTYQDSLASLGITDTLMVELKKTRN